MKRAILYDVVVIRLILIVLLVLYHSFAIYNGAWSMPEGIHEVNSYWWLASFAYSFMLEAFVFISGYVWGYQVRTKYDGILDFNRTVVKKAKRLLIPSVIFSFIYLICFNWTNSMTWGGQIYYVLNGAGHMWFLPMLFWCFVALFVVEKLNIPSKYVIILALLATVCSIVPLPLRLSSAAYYFIFFYCGYCIQRNDIKMSTLLTRNNIAISALLYLVFFVSSKLLFNSDSIVAFSEESVMHKAIFLMSHRIAVLVYSGLGLAFIYILINYLLKKNMINVTHGMIKFSAYCFGVYIFQQFILKYIVYNGASISLLGSYWLPWVAFVITLLLSVLLSWGMLKTRVGRFLIG